MVTKAKAESAELAIENETYEQGYWARQGGNPRQAYDGMVGESANFFLEGWDRADAEIMAFGEKKKASTEILLNSSILPPHAEHPGWAADGCPPRGIINGAVSAAGLTYGFNCRVTGGHCLPGLKCDSYRAEWQKFVDANA